MPNQPDTISHVTLEDEHGNRFSVNIVVGSCFVSVLNPDGDIGIVLDLFNGMLRGELYSRTTNDPEVFDIYYLDDQEDDEEEGSDDA